MNYKNHFLSKLKEFDTLHECWNWPGADGPNGYGLAVVGPHKRRLAHRYSFEIFNGEIPDGMCVLHKCDNRKCVNPSHLFLGTSMDNMRDKIAKGRSVVGFGGKLSESQAREILLMSGVRCKIARQFGVSVNTVDAIKRRKTWKKIKV